MVVIHKHNMIVFTKNMQVKKKQIKKNDVKKQNTPYKIAEIKKQNVPPKNVDVKKPQNTIRTNICEIKKVINDVSVKKQFDRNVRFDINLGSGDELILEVDNDMIRMDKDIMENIDISSREDVVRFVNNIIKMVSNNINRDDDKKSLTKRKTLKKCLMIGINYTGSEHELKGCINDTENLKNMLVRNGAIRENEITFMNDKTTGEYKPTKLNIINKLDELVKFANDNKNDDVEIILTYSGHGTNCPDGDADECDVVDEFICPIDCDINGDISDDYIKKYLIDELGKNVTLFVLIDACHSGSILDLKYAYKCGKKTSYTTQNKPDSMCNVVMISGCKDDQFSADTYAYDKVDKRIEAQGAMTAAFIDSYEKNITANELLTKMRSWLRLRLHTQEPELSSGRLIDINKRFILDEFY